MLNNAALNILVQSSCYAHAGVSLGCNLGMGMELLGHNLCMSSTILDNIKLFTKEVEHQCSSVYESPCCFTCSQTLDIIKFSDAFQFSGNWDMLVQYIFNSSLPLD